MSKNLVIVESPAKAKTIKKHLGKEFDVLASYGHVRDLIPKSGAVDPDHGFAMHYQLIEKNAKHANAIAKAIKNYSTLYLATDPDREGEAIAWHIYEFLKEKKSIQDKTVHRITFHEITQNAIQKAINQPKDLGMDLVHAQQARRALDYLVGFTLSPLLWKKVRRGLSAGRVQSPALRLIVEREIEIETFTSKEYWTLLAQVAQHPDSEAFQAKLLTYRGNKIQQFSITDETEAHAIKADLLKDAQGYLRVEKIDKKQRKRQPAAPFITSTLQQEASHKLGFTAQRTMRIAQQLYEGIDTGSGPIGLITYMRTDSTTLSQEAIQATRELISAQYGDHALPDKPRAFRTKSKNAQEAHEAIRPTHIEYTPDSIKSQLNNEQFRLYDLIWKRTVASQMIHATLEVLSIELSGGNGNTYRATGTTILAPGFISVYQETPDAVLSEEKMLQSESSTPLLPAVKTGDQLILNDIKATQHFTEPPPRYNEASLIKTLEAHGIGRPSTYVPIITTLQQREYVIWVQKRFHPTDVGRIVYQFLINYFTAYIDYDFTANLENELDEIARGEKQWQLTLSSFWKRFKERIEHIESTVQRHEVTQEAINENCPKCQKPLNKRLGKRGSFIGCSGYPECDYTRNLDEDSGASTEPEILKDRLCPNCHNALHIKVGRYGKFIGCSQYPKCKHMEPLEKPSGTNVSCPECQKGELLQRKSRYGKIFYSCGRYPECQYAIWHAPINKPCPRCAWPILTIKTTKRKGTELVCPRKTCGYNSPYESVDDNTD
jgi:DNA topoisomerase-1